MSDAIDQQGCFRHRANVRFFTIYEDFQDIAKGKHADKIAAFLRILEVKTNKKIIAYQVQAEEAKQNGQPMPKLNLWLEVSYNDFASWSLHTFGKSSFQIADKEAEKMLFCKSRLRKRRSRHEDPQSPLVEYKEYLLVLENIQAALDGQELPITKEKFEAHDTPTSLNVPPIKINTGAPKINKGLAENNKYKSKDKETIINLKENTGSSNALRDDNASSVSKKVSETEMPLTEKEQRVIKWYCEVAKVQKVTMTIAAQECLTAIAPEMESMEDVRGLYEQTKVDIKNRKDATNKNVFFANTKDSLFAWKQNKLSGASQQVQGKGKANMSLEEAQEVVRVAGEQGKQYDYAIQAQAISSSKVEGAWIVKVKCEGVRFSIPTIYCLADWEKAFHNLHDFIELEARLQKEKAR